MRPGRRILLLCSWLALVSCRVEPATSPDAPASPDTPALVETPLEADPLQATVHRLSNGMTVYLTVDHTLPQVQTYVVVAAGSAQEPSSSTGLAHYLEHMMFKGTDELATRDFAAERPHLQRIAELYDDLAKASAPQQRDRVLAEIDAENQAAARYAVPGDMDRLYGTLGIAGLNAWTWFDETSYSSVVPANRLAQWAEVEAERFGDPQFRLFLPELESVYEEKNLELDSPGEQTEMALRRLTLGEHPYAHPILGTTAHLKTPAYGDMVEFYERWYTPSNMAVVLAGDFEPAQVLPLLERTFGTLQGSAAPAHDLAPPKPLSRRVFAKVEAPGTAQVRMAWPTQGAAHADAVVLDVIAELLDNPGSGLLTLSLERPQVVPAVYASSTVGRSGGWLTIGAVARDDQSLADVERLLLEQVQRLRDGDFTSDDLQAVIRQMELDELYDWEDNSERADALLDSFSAGVDWPDAVQTRVRRRSLTREDLMRVARSTLGDGFAVVHKVDGDLDPPKLTKPKITPVTSDDTASSAWAKAVAAHPIDPLEPRFVREGRDLRRGALPAGELLWAHNPRNALMQVTYRFEVGEAARPKLCLAMQLLEVSDTAEATADQLQQELYGLGATINFDCGTHSSSIHVFGPDENLERVLELLRQWLTTGKADESRWAKLRDNELSLRRDALQQPRFQSTVLDYYASMDQHSPFLQEPANEVLRTVERGELLAEVGRLVQLPHRTLYFGPRSMNDVKGVVTLGTPTLPVPERPALHLRHPTRTRVFVLDQPRVGVDVAVYWARPTPQLQERSAVRVLNYYLDGDSSSRVYRELREARGLVYSSSAGFATADRPLDDAYFEASLSTQADKAEEALQLLLQVVTDPIDAKLFAIARDSVEQSMRRRRTGPRALVYAMRGWDDEGLEGDPRRAIWDGLQSLQPADLERFVAPLREQPAIITVAGDLDAIGRDALERFGVVTEVQPADLVSW